MTIRALFKRKSAVVLGGVLATLAMASPTAFGASALPGSAAPATMTKAAASVDVKPKALSVTCSVQSLPVDCWVIEPTVNRPSAEYQAIEFTPGQHVVVDAGGCVQTGGHGLTWKSYVYPYPDVGRYYGKISVPGATNGLVPLWTVIGRTLTVGANGGPLMLGYEDDGYSDNGYYAHDNGTADQCKNVENAWVHILIS